MSEQNHILDYGAYKALTEHPRFREVAEILNEASDKSGVRYAIIGGLATYLYTHNPPEDYPDIDVLLDANARRAREFVAHVKGRMHDSRIEEHGEEMFSSFMYHDLQIDIFTSRESRPAFRIPLKRKRDLPLEPAENLIVEKLIRGTWSDIQSAFDLLMSKQYDAVRLREIAAQYRVTGRIHAMERLIDRYESGKITKPVYVRLAQEFVEAP